MNANAIQLERLEIPIAGMDCAECTQHVQHAIAALPGVEKVDVLLTSEKAFVTLDRSRVDMPMIRQAVAGAGYSVPETPILAPSGQSVAPPVSLATLLPRQLGIVLLVVFGVVLFVVVVGEWLGLFGALTTAIPFWLGAALVLLAGAPIFRNVLRAAWHKQVISHTLMSLGVFAALAVGQWVTALVVIFF